MDFLAKHWGDLASVLGFALTIWFAWLAKSAADQARAAAEQVREQLSRFDTIAELSAAITIIEEIMRLQRTQAWDIVWDIVLDRHSILRGHLVRSQAGIDGEALRSAVRGAVSHFRIMVEEIERARTEPQQSKLDTAAFNQRLSDQVEVLEKVRIGVKKAGV
jgi:hypothetical protein